MMDAQMRLWSHTGARFFLNRELREVTNNNQQKSTKNGFEIHGLKRISVSNVNKFREAPDAWACQYLGKQRFPSGWAAVQGQAVEAGVELSLFNGLGIDDAQQHAISFLKKESLFFDNKLEEIEKRTPIIKRMVENALEQLMPLGMPELPEEGKRQHSIKVPVRFAEGDNGTVDLIGYLDFWYPEHNLIVDLKTTSKAPSKWSLSHGIQAAVYQKAVSAKHGKEPQVKFLYCLTRQKDPFIWMEMTEGAEYLKKFKFTVQHMERLLRLSNDSNEIIASIPHNPDTFYWNNAQEIAATLYGAWGL